MSNENTRVISVATKRPAEVPAYLYKRTAQITGPSYLAYGKTTILFITVTSDEAEGVVAQAQADRLSSGMHGARVHADLADAEAWIREACYDDDVLIPITPATA